MPESEEGLTDAELKDFAGKRMAYATLYEIFALCVQRDRMKKPFNPILGETYEYVAENYRGVAE